MTPETIEKRCLMTGVALRAAPSGAKSPGTLVGYASVFGPLSVDLGNFRERIAPGAFRECLKTADIRALVNHDPNKLLGRSKSGTLRLDEDAVGLRMEVDLPDTAVGRDTAESIRRGDMEGSSFSFEVADGDAGQSWEFPEGHPPVRTVRCVRRVHDVGPVTYPAYEDTRVAMRTLDAARRAAEPAPPPPATTPPPVDPTIALNLARDTARLRLLETF